MRTKKIIVVLAALLVLWVIYGVDPQTPTTKQLQPIVFNQSNLSVVTSEGALEFQVEVATTEEQKTLGLMHRTQLEEKHGMLFDFGRPQHIEMWMKDTLIPLDMIFINSDGVITHIHEQAVAGSTQTIDSEGAAQMVLELSAGSVKRYHIKTGDKLLYSGLP